MRRTMGGRALTRVWASLLVLFGAPALADHPLAALTQKYGPNGNGTLAYRDDVQWLAFHDARIASDEKAGVYTASFGALLAKLDRQPIVITGSMLPVATATQSPHFVLTRRSASCPFCPPNEPTEAIEVDADRLVRQTQAPVTVQGRLHLVAGSAQGLFFRIDDARVR